MVCKKKGGMYKQPLLIVSIGFIKQQIRLASNKKTDKSSIIATAPTKETAPIQYNHKSLKSTSTIKSNVFTMKKPLVQRRKIHDDYNSFINSSFHQPHSPPVSVH
jgi:hypothetical protein